VRKRLEGEGGSQEKGRGLSNRKSLQKRRNRDKLKQGVRGERGETLKGTDQERGVRRSGWDHPNISTSLGGRRMTDYKKGWGQHKGDKEKTKES